MKYSVIITDNRGEMLEESSFNNFDVANAYFMYQMKNSSFRNGIIKLVDNTRSQQEPLFFFKIKKEGDGVN